MDIFSIVNGRLRRSGVPGAGPFQAGQVTVGLHAIDVDGSGPYAGATATQVVKVLPGNNSVTLTLVEP